jgi:hypothetical protein
MEESYFLGVCRIQGSESAGFEFGIYNKTQSAEGAFQLLQAKFVRGPHRKRIDTKCMKSP